MCLRWKVQEWPRLRNITCIYAAPFWEGIHKHSQEYEKWWEDFYDVYERMTYVYMFEKPKVWIF